MTLLNLFGKITKFTGLLPATLLSEGFYTPLIGSNIGQPFAMALEIVFDNEIVDNKYSFLISGNISLENICTDSQFIGELHLSLPFLKRAGFDIYFKDSSGVDSYCLRTSINDFQAILWEKGEVQFEGKLLKNDEVYADISMTFPFEQIMRIFPTR